MYMLSSVIEDVLVGSMSISEAADTLYAAGASSLDVMEMMDAAAGVDARDAAAELELLFARVERRLANEQRWLHEERMLEAYGADAWRVEEYEQGLANQVSE